MTYNQIPNPQGLYNPDFEHDACGIGLYASLKGNKTHEIVQKGLHMLCQLDHRGGQGSDPHTGDGAGLLVQMPDTFFKKQCAELNLPEQGRYGVGMLFFSNEEEREEEEAYINTLIEAEGQKVLGWRSVPINVRKIGIAAQNSCPIIRQVFIEASDEMEKGLPFERKLYVIRKQAENWALEQDKQFYFASLSSQTIVYKGLLLPEQMDSFYEDLLDEDFVSAFSLVHSRFSTNTFPSWERAHPNRYLIHNGEINTLRGNKNWMKAREKQMASEAFGDDLDKILPIIDSSGSDSSALDNAFEFFVLSGRKPAHAAMMLIPEPWTENEHLTPEKRAFYQYHSTLMEPWDGPTSITFTDGNQIGGILDRNGLRPARYYVTKDDMLIYSSEVGVIDVEEDNILYKNRLSPGKMLLIDLEQQRIISDEEVKHDMASEHPYQEWLDKNLWNLEPEGTYIDPKPVDDAFVRQKAFGYTYEDIHKYLLPMVTEGKDPVGAMGNDTPLAVLSENPQSLFLYFKQHFAQVTNPAIDSIREQMITSTTTLLGAEGNILHPNESNSHRIQLKSPVLSADQMDRIRDVNRSNFRCKTLDAVFTNDLEAELEELCNETEAAIEEGYSLLILSDRTMGVENVAVPPLLAASAVHQHLVQKGKRKKASLIVESGEIREVHHFAALIGYGVDAIYPYLAYETFRQTVEDGSLDMDVNEAVQAYRKHVTTGIVKVMSKMGISTVQSYRGAQIFEAVGISKDVINRYFTGTVSQLDGIDLNTISKEAKIRHTTAYEDILSTTLEPGSDFQWRKTGEHHAFNPQTVHTLQWACRKNDYNMFKEYSKAANKERIGFLRNLFTFKSEQSVPIEEVESVEDIVRRFKTGAMSFGSLSQEAHETLAIAMNRLGGRSNSGEGGEDSSRFHPDENGDSRRSSIKQIASGRFGVSSHYLVNADELQIKVAQGAKPGEGGQLPGKKVYPWVADVRGSTPGVGLISPPPHHDIYSIEDLAQLIHDLKNANRDARISVKLVAKSGIGTIAAGVAKGSADVISVSGYDGGTGASPKTSIKHAGLPWELGLAETHQTLVLNNLRDRVVLETDGKLMTGRDVAMAAILGAEEYGFATAPLVVIGCVMMRVCHKDTCPVGVATQNPELRKKFTGHADYVVNYMQFVAEELREIMAELGFRTVEEMVGRTDVLEVSEETREHWKAKSLDLANLVYQPKGPKTCKRQQDHNLDKSLDLTTLLPAVKSSINTGKRIELSYPIRNTNRVVGTIVGSEISKRYGEEGLPADTIRLNFTGSAGQSFGAFIPRGLSLHLTGDANDYVGKGLSGGKVVVSKPQQSPSASDDVIIGNVALYGASKGEAYINGVAGERFAVRNSGANVVVEGVGNHGCEYMTGGRVVVLGDVGANFAAGMSGGVAYVLADDKDRFKSLCNTGMIEFESLEDPMEAQEVQTLVQNHFEKTNSLRAAHVLEHWEMAKRSFVKIIPKDYKNMLNRIEAHRADGLTEDEAVMSAFQGNPTKQEQEATDASDTPQVALK
ncbi:glutamate synthase large subunit [Pontibacillus yanchengensis]|uniref:Glutamate synthase large subunit n=1 Tax=Pontibacillus yanchengensis TaxID=462910 RepID=A0A6I5A375_9BACI|nr:glutamate synthase large subunit [Pontibacillus yanchengensis]MYL32899.1 glutamate synthase large subunit [Pontibacillus yanchengensis]